MKKWIVPTAAALAFSMALTAVPAAAADLKIGYIVTQRLQSETKLGKEVITKLKGKAEGLQGSLKKKGEDLKKLQEDANKRAAVLNDTEKAKLAEEMEKQYREGKRMEEDSRREMEKMQSQLLGDLTEKLRGVIEKFAKDNNYDMILDASLMLYISKKADVTDEVIQLVDKSL